MKKGTKVQVDLSEFAAKRLQIGPALKGEGVISGEYTNGIPGHYVDINKRTVGIPDRLNAVTPMSDGSEL